MNKYNTLKLKILSFILIIMVVFLHSYSISSANSVSEKLATRGYNSFLQHFLSEEITRIAVPLFFLISGFLFFFNLKGTKEEFLVKFKKRAKSLLVPYLFWSSIWILIYFCFQYFPQTQAFFAGKPVRDFLILEFLNTLFINPIPFQLWFLRDLIILVLISPLVYLLIKNFKYLPFLILLLGWYLNVNYYFVVNEALLFFTAGASISLIKNKILELNFSAKDASFIFLWFGIVLTATILDYINFENLTIQNILHKTGILAGITAIWILYDLLTNKNIEKNKVSEIYSFSFFIFVFHLPLITFVKKILLKMGNSELISFSIYLLAPIIVIIISIIVGYLLKKIAKPFYEIITGGR